MADQTDTKGAGAPTAPFPTPSLEDIQHWTFVMGRAQQMMMEHLAAQMGQAAAQAPEPEKVAQAASQWPGMTMFGDPAKLMQAQAELWTEGLDIWQRAFNAPRLRSGRAEGEEGAEEK